MLFLSKLQGKSKINKRIHHANKQTTYSFLRFYGVVPERRKSVAKFCLRNTRQQLAAVFRKGSNTKKSIAEHQQCFNTL